MWYAFVCQGKAGTNNFQNLFEGSTTDVGKLVIAFWHVLILRMVGFSLCFALFYFIYFIIFYFIFISQIVNIVSDRRKRRSSIVTGGVG